MSRKINTNYKFLDSGNGKRLEIFNNIKVVRTAKQAVWKPALSKTIWQKADLIFENGKWSGNFPKDSFVRFSNNIFEIKTYSQGQIGLFPEQENNWYWLERKIQNYKNYLRIVNGFAYTGASTVFSSYTNTEVCHLDSSKASVKQAKRNIELSNKSSNKVRFIVDDVITFLQKELKRNSYYNGFIFDPPAFGRGEKNKIWKFERDLPKLFDLINALSNGNLVFLLISAHHKDYSEVILKRTLLEHIKLERKEIETGRMVLISEKGHSLPNGYYVRWFKKH
jgi:23S rRNA (cytosine1962-C5)-methyltransferase